MTNIKEAEVEQKEETNVEKTLETFKDPRLKEIFSRLHESMEQSGLDEVDELKKEIINTSTESEQQVFSFLPHQLAKTSIFFPMSDKELKEGSRRINRIEQETGWGKIVIDGIKLAIFEEDIFLATIIPIKERPLQLHKYGYLIEENMKDIVHTLYGLKSYTKKTYERIKKAFEHFQLIRFEIITGEWKKKGKERLRVNKIRAIGSIISKFEYNENNKDIKIYFNPAFIDFFLESMLTNINLSLRRKLKRDGSKALLRFLSTHNEPSRMHMLTVLNAINFNTQQPKYRLRSRLNEFIRELKEHNVLGEKTKLYSDDTVFFEVISSQKKLPK